MTRFCTSCKKVVSAGHGRITEIDGKIFFRPAKMNLQRTSATFISYLHRRHESEDLRCQGTLKLLLAGNQSAIPFGFVVPDSPWVMQDTNRAKKERPVLERLQKKVQVRSTSIIYGVQVYGYEDRLPHSPMLQASRYDDMSKMMTKEQAENENAELPDGYKYVLIDDLEDITNTSKEMPSLSK